MRRIVSIVVIGLLLLAIGGTLALLDIRRDFIPPVLSLALVVGDKEMSGPSVDVTAGALVTPKVIINDNIDSAPRVTLALSRDIAVGDSTASYPNAPEVGQQFQLSGSGVYTLRVTATDRAGNTSMAVLELRVLDTPVQDAFAIVERSTISEDHGRLSGLDLTILLGSKHNLSQLSKFHLVLQLLDSKGAMITRPLNEVEAEYLEGNVWKVTFSKQFDAPLTQLPHDYCISSFVGTGEGRWYFFTNTISTEPNPDALSALHSLVSR